MNVVHLELLVVCNNTKNSLKVLKGVQKYHLKIVCEVILHAILYQIPLIYLRKLPLLKVRHQETHIFHR